MRDRINDSFVDVVLRKPTEEEINTISEILPKDVVLLADQWGWNDTEVREKVTKWIQENKNIFK